MEACPHYDCANRNSFGYCKTTGCINPNYNFRSLTVNAEPTEEQVKEYCRKRCLAIVDSELFNEMKVKHGYWARRPLWKNEPLEYTTANYYRCSVCNHPSWAITDYCPHCGSKMDEVKYE